ncbi:MAG: anti-sigma factor antagonist [Lachnospiraceae bacterium]|nr:anti-sigma factor antagonist [Lachnospiraceae bacterium]
MEKKERELIHYEIRQNCLIIYISQDLDHHAVDILREQSDRLIDAGNIRHIIFDFTENDFMDSSGIGLIMGRYKKVMFRGGKAAVTNVGNEIERIFNLSGLFKIIERYKTPEQAIAGLNEREAQNETDHR